MNDDTTQRAAFFFGMGIMGVLAGFGFGSKAPNKLALLIGAGSLFYANYLTPMVEFQASPELQESWEDLPRQIPSIPTPSWPSGAKVTFGAE